MEYFVLNYFMCALSALVIFLISTLRKYLLFFLTEAKEEKAMSFPELIISIAFIVAIVLPIEFAAICSFFVYTKAMFSGVHISISDLTSVLQSKLSPIALLAVLTWIIFDTIAIYNAE